MRIKRLLALVAVAAVALTMSGCGQKDEENVASFISKYEYEKVITSENYESRWLFDADECTLEIIVEYNEKGPNQLNQSIIYFCELKVTRTIATKVDDAWVYEEQISYRFNTTSNQDTITYYQGEWTLG